MFSLESPQRGDSNEHTQYTISQYEKKNHPKSSQICSYGVFSKGPKNEFETAVVNEPLVFEPLKFYCISPRTSVNYTVSEYEKWDGMVGQRQSKRESICCCCFTSMANSYGRVGTLKDRFLEFRRYHNFANLFSKFSKSTFTKK